MARGKKVTAKTVESKIEETPVVETPTVEVEPIEETPIVEETPVVETPIVDETPVSKEGNLEWKDEKKEEVIFIPKETGEVPKNENKALDEHIAKQKEAKAEIKGKRVWVKDHTELVAVEGTNQTAMGNEYYGVKRD